MGLLPKAPEVFLDPAIRLLLSIAFCGNRRCSKVMAFSARDVLPRGAGEAQSAILWVELDPPVRVHRSNIDLDSTIAIGSFFDLGQFGRVRISA